MERVRTQELCLTVRHDALPQNKQAFSYIEGQPRMPWGRQRERERKTRERKREKSAVKVIWWDGESQSKENKEAHQMREEH